MRGTCSIRWRGRVQKHIQKFQTQNLRERTTWRPKRKLEYNIKMAIKDTEYEMLGSINVAQDTDQQRVLVSV
jgi:hypothetical protein